MSTPIDLIYEATTPLAVPLPALMVALQYQVDLHAGPIWGISCQLSVQVGSRPNVQRIIFLDDADQADALGYHELTPDGLPQAKVFVQTTVDCGENPTVTASHELLEMLVDPNLDRTALRQFKDRVYALECCDAVEASVYLVNDIAVSNFQTPQWFGMYQSQTVPNAGTYDYMNYCKHPWQMLSGGYVSILENGEWQQLFASTVAASAFRTGMKWRPQARESGAKRRSAR